MAAIGLSRIFSILVVTIALSFAVPLFAFALEVPPVPTDVPIVDQTNTLTTEQKQSLAGIIAKERSETGNQIGILIIPSLEDEALEDYSLQVARQWGIGAKERNSGVLLLVVKEDRKVRIEVGYGLEGALTDIRSNQIIRNRITPEFQQGRYYEGVRSGVDGIIAAVHGETDPRAKQEQGVGFSVPWEAIAFGLFFIPTWLGAILGRTKSWWAGGVIGAVAGTVLGFIFGFLMIGVISIAILTIVGLFFDRAVSNNYQRHVADGSFPSWWAGGTHLGGGPGGGFGGFGGGSFGGGGASGDW